LDKDWLFKNFIRIGFDLTRYIQQLNLWYSTKYKDATKHQRKRKTKQEKEKENI